MTTDARRVPRTVVALEAGRGVFLVKAGQRQFRLREVSNVSPSGAGLCLPVPVDKGSTVTLTYTEDDWHVTILGDVVWSKPADDSARSADDDAAQYRVGVAFRSTEPEDNTLFFLALRERLDRFTWA